MNKDLEPGQLLPDATDASVVNMAAHLAAVDRRLDHLVPAIDWIRQSLGNLAPLLRNVQDNAWSSVQRLVDELKHGPLHNLKPELDAMAAMLRNVKQAKADLAAVDATKALERIERRTEMVLGDLERATSFQERMLDAWQHTEHALRVLSRNLRILALKNVRTQLKRKPARSAAKKTSKKTAKKKAKKGTRRRTR